MTFLGFVVNTVNMGRTSSRPRKPDNTSDQAVHFTIYPTSPTSLSGPSAAKALLPEDGDYDTMQL